MSSSQKKWLSIAVLLGITGVSPAFGSETDLAKLQLQVQQLIKQNQQLNQRIAEMEMKFDGGQPVLESQKKSSSPVPEELLRTKVQQVVRKELRQQQEEEGRAQKINEYVTLFGLIEGEAVFGEDFEGNNFSEFNVATVELGFDVQMSEWAVGHILAIYEGGDDDDLFIDEANIWLGNYEKYPLLLTAGKFYMPFGNFETNMIQDPLTLEIGEINDYGAAIGLEHSGFYGAVFGYNGLKEMGSSETISGFGLMAGYTYEHEEMTLETGISWVSNIADSGGISDALDDKGLDTVRDHVSGLSLNILGSYGPFSLLGEYTTPLDSFAPIEIGFAGNGAEPKAWNVELGYSTELLDKESVFAIGFQGTDEALELGLPEIRIIGTASFVILNGTTVSFEYFYDEDYSLTDGGTGESAGTFTTQLAYEF